MTPERLSVIRELLADIQPRCRASRVAQELLEAYDAVVAERDDARTVLSDWGRTVRQLSAERDVLEAERDEVRAERDGLADILRELIDGGDWRELLMRAEIAVAATRE